MAKRKQKNRKTIGFVIKTWLSHHPYFYALIGGTGLILFWRGMWLTADLVMQLLTNSVSHGSVSLGAQFWWDGPLSAVLGIAILSTADVFVSNLIGNEIILAGLKAEKRLEQKESKAIHDESIEINDIRKVLDQVMIKLDHLEEHSIKGK